MKEKVLPSAVSRCQSWDQVQELVSQYSFTNQILAIIFGPKTFLTKLNANISTRCQI